MATPEQEELERCTDYSLLYKKRYLIAFYDKDDDLVGVYNNVADIAVHMGIEPKSSNKKYRSLKSQISACVHKKEPNSRFIYMDHTLVRPFLIDCIDENVDQEILL